MSKLIVWALSLVLMVPSSWGRSPARVQPFQQYIDHYQFTQLSSTEQKAFLISVMETMAEMEQEVIDADKILTQDHMQKMQLREKKKALNQLKEIFEQFSQNVSIPSAYANAGTQYCSPSAVATLRNKHIKKPNEEFVTCMYGTYMSNMVQNGNSRYCARPACSGNPEFANAHNNAARAAGCSPAQMVCNPSIYGTNTQTRRASCVTLDFAGPNGSFENIAHNVSLACLMEVRNDPKKDDRLAAIAQAIINPPSGNKRDAANNFKRMLSIITNVCFCGSVGGFDGQNVNYYEKNFDPAYVQYLNGHRSCNALLSQMQLLTAKISENANYCQENAFLPKNLSSLSTSLQAFANYSNRLNSLMSSRSNWNPNNPQDRQSAMRLLRQRWIRPNDTIQGISTSITTENALDNIYTEAEMKEKRTRREANGTVHRVCPLQIDDPTPPTPEALTCTLTVNSQSRTNATTVALSATASVQDARNTEVSATMAWKLNDQAIPEQTAKELTTNANVTAETKQFTLTGTATFGTQSIECSAPPFTSELPSNPAQPSCTLSASTGTFSITNGKFVLSALPTATPSANLVGPLIWFYDDAEVDPSDITAPGELLSDLVLTGKIKQGDQAIECGVVSFSRNAPEDPKPPTTCTVSISSPTAQTQGPPFDVVANLTVKDEQNREISDIGTGVIKWNLNGREINKNLTTLQGEKSDTRVVRVSATVNTISCPEVSVVVPEPPVTPEGEKKACDLSVTQAPAGPGLFSVEASVSTPPDEGQSVTFSGMSELKLVEGKKDVARGNIAGIAQAQKKTIKASYKAGGKDLECQKEIEIPAAQASGPAGPGQQPFVPPAEGSFLLQKRGVN